MSGVAMFLPTGALNDSNNLRYGSTTNIPVTNIVCVPGKFEQWWLPKRSSQCQMPKRLHCILQLPLLLK